MVMQTAMPLKAEAREPGQPRITPLRMTTWAMFGSTLLMVALPMFYLLYGSFVQDGGEHAFTLGNYAEVYGGEVFLSRFWNTVVLSATVAVLAILLGSLLAWVVARTNAPGVRKAAPLLIVPIMMSNLVTCLAWIALAAPNAGLLNVLIFNLTGIRRVLDIYSFTGMVWVLVLNYAAFAFVSVLGALRSIDADLEEASYLLGVNPVKTAFSMTLPLVFPTLASTFLLVFVFVAENFAVPLVLGTPSGYETLMSQIYYAVADTPAKPGLAAAAGTMLLLIALVGTLWQRRIMANAKRYVTMGGKGGRRKTTDLGRWRYLASAVVFGYLFFSVVLPYCALVTASLMRFVTSRLTWELWTLDNYRKLSDGTFLHLLTNSFLVAVVGGVVAVAFYFVLSYLLSTSQTRFARLTEYAAIMPTVTPSILLAIGFLWAFVALPLPLYGTLGLIFIALVVRSLGLGVRQSRSALLQVSTDLVDAARIGGAGPLKAFRDIVAPALKAPLMSIWTLIFVQFFLDVGLSVVLYSPNSMTIPVYLWTKMNGGEVTGAFAIAVLECTIIFAVLFVAERLFGTVRASLNR
ncbi:iron ABC transporter permease [Frigidibacter sp. MR17.14]|uniref:ABC transporter permease n=1 Tax=Frigidibacter sp. MR17.14 TaxID=3126509 RepID=UPI003012FE94